MNEWQKIEETYPKDDDYNRNWFYDYVPLLKSFGYEVLLQVDEYNYQGDSIVIFHDKENNRFGYLMFGWGSCSGCDSLQACSTYKDVEELRKSIHSDIKWFESFKELVEWVSNHDYEGDYTDKKLVSDFKSEFEKLKLED